MSGKNAINRKRGPRLKRDELCNTGILDRVDTYWYGFRDEMLDEFDLNLHDYETQGITRGKYLAALCMLTRLNLKDISRYAGISYGTMRNWSAQEHFREVLDALADEFARYVIKRLGQEFDEYLALTDESDNLIIWPPDVVNIYKQNDMACYSELVMQYIHTNIRLIGLDIMPEEGRHQFHGFLLSIFGDVRYSYEELKGVLRDSMSVLSSDVPLSKNERIAIIQLLEMLQCMLHK